MVTHIGKKSIRNPRSFSELLNMSSTDGLSSELLRWSQFYVSFKTSSMSVFTREKSIRNLPVEMFVFSTIRDFVIVWLKVVHKKPLLFSVFIKYSDAKWNKYLQENFSTNATFTPTLVMRWRIMQIEGGIIHWDWRPRWTAAERDEFYIRPFLSYLRRIRRLFYKCTM